MALRNVLEKNVGTIFFPATTCLFDRYIVRGTLSDLTSKVEIRLIEIICTHHSIYLLLIFLAS